MTQKRQLTIEERWQLDNNQPHKGVNVTPPTPETLEWVKAFEEDTEKPQ